MLLPRAGMQLTCVQANWSLHEMIMIAFITSKGSLIPFVEGLCAQIQLDSSWKFQYCVDIFCFSFSEGNVRTKKKCSQFRFYPAAQHIYIHVNFVHVSIDTHTDIYMPRFSLPGFFGLSNFLDQTPWAHVREIHMQCVCVCVRTYIHKHTNTPNPRQNSEDTDNTSISLSVKNNPPRHQQVP